MSEAASRTPLLVRLYREFLESCRSADFIAAVMANYRAAALERLAASREPETRRAAILAAGLCLDYTANETLGRALADGDRAVRMLAENGLRAVWRRQGSESQRRRLEQLIRLNRAGDCDAAVAEARTLIRVAPTIAEAWRQKGVAHFHQGRLHTALADFGQAVELNRFHFDALVGMATCHLQLHDAPAALDRFEQALRLNRDLAGVRARVIQLQRQEKHDLR